MKLALLADAAHVNILRFCEGLAAEGAEIHLVSFSAPGSDAFKFYRLPRWPLLSKAKYFLGVRALRKVLNQIQPDALLAYYATGYGTLAALSGFKPLVIITAGSDVLLAPRSPLLRGFLSNNLKKADLVTAWAPHMAEAAARLGAPSDRLFVLPRGIPIEDFTRRRCPEPAAVSEIALVSTRSLLPIYGIDLVLEALAQLVADGRALKLTVAGEGPLKRALIARAAALGLGARVDFVGKVGNDKLPELLSRHHVYVSAASSDGVSASLLEAMAVGIFPVVADIAANRQWIRSGENGLLFAPGDARALALAIAGAADDVALRRRAWQANQALTFETADYRKNARAYLQRFEALSRGTM